MLVPPGGGASFEVGASLNPSSSCREISAWGGTRSQIPPEGSRRPGVRARVIITNSPR